MRHGKLEVDEISGRHLDWALFRRFLGLLGPYRASVVVAFGLLPLAAAGKLVQPYLLKVAIDDYIVPGRIEGLGGVASLFLLALLAESLLIYAQGYLVQAVGQSLMRDLRRSGFRKMLRLPVAFFDRYPSGRLVTRLTSDIENIGEMFGAGVVASVGDIFTLVFIVWIMAAMSPQLTLVSFVVLPVLLAGLILFRRNMRGAMRQVRARLAGLNGYVAERVAGAAEVQLFGQEERTAGEFAELQEAYRRSIFRVVGWDASLYALVEAVGAVAIAAILWQGGGDVVSGVTTFGTLVAFIEYVQKFFVPLRDLSAKYSVIQASNASLERVFDLLDQAEEPVGSGGLAPGAGEVVFEGVDFSYDGTTPVLKGVDLAIRPGETVALVGATGSGKTTLVRLLMQFYPPGGGHILLDGVDTATLDPALVRQRIGWVSQDPFLFSGRVRENLDPEGELEDGELRGRLEAARLWKTVAQIGGLEAVLSERGKNLSAGQRQLLCLARALVKNPELLILDEATSRLDTETEAAVAEGLSAARRGRSVVLIAHRLRTAATADRIVVMHRGRIREQGTHRQLIAAGGIYARLWKLQQLGGEDISEE